MYYHLSVPSCSYSVLSHSSFSLSEVDSVNTKTCSDSKQNQPSALSLNYLACIWQDDHERCCSFSEADMRLAASLQSALANEPGCQMMRQKHMLYLILLCIQSKATSCKRRSSSGGIKFLFIQVCPYPIPLLSQLSLLNHDLSFCHIRSYLVMCQNVSHFPKHFYLVWNKRNSLLKKQQRRR